jgi:hypothetical protein
VATFFLYLGALAAIFAFCALVADLWGARIERRLRDQARAEARAKRANGEDPFHVEWQPPFSSQ